MDTSTEHSAATPKSARPPGPVLQAWRVDEVTALSGGQAQAFRSNQLVFKPAPEEDRSIWLADALDGLAPVEGLRIARPARSVDGRWVVDGWAAWHWLDGESWTPTLSELLDVSARFHAAVERVAWDPAMRGADRWAEADRMAWGEADQTLPDQLKLLAERRRPVPLARQLAHGDLHGNVLTCSGLAPAVIDISPYWRPSAYADAIVLVDRAVDRGTSVEPDVLGPHGWQLVLRAVLFRAMSEPEPTDAYDDLIERLLVEA